MPMRRRNSAHLSARTFITQQIQQDGSASRRLCEGALPKVVPCLYGSALIGRTLGPYQQGLLQSLGIPGDQAAATRSKNKP